jgi:hypothetical protein
MMQECNGGLWLSVLMTYSEQDRGWDMVWKQDLAKLKQQLEEEPKAPPKPTPKPVPKPTGPKDLGEEDAVFLAAMGHKPLPPERRLEVKASEPVIPSHPHHP